MRLELFAREYQDYTHKLTLAFGEDLHVGEDIRVKFFCQCKVEMSGFDLS
jgi:hypothetical protein